MKSRAYLWSIPAILMTASLSLADVPRWIASSDPAESGRPLWVSVEEAAPNGFLRWDLFEAHQQDSFRTSLQRRPKAPAREENGDTGDRCRTWIYPSGERGKAWSPPELLDRAGAVYRAMVSDVTTGFLNGSPGTMIEATVQEVIKPPKHGEALQQILVFYRYAEIEVDGGLLCVRDIREPATPRIGGTLVLTPRDAHPDYPELNLFWVEDTELFFDAADGRFSSPSAYGEQLAKGSALIDALRSAAMRTGEAQ